MRTICKGKQRLQISATQRLWGASGSVPTSFANSVFGLPFDQCQGTGDGNNYAPNVAICYIAMSRVRGPLAPRFLILTRKTADQHVGFERKQLRTTERISQVMAGTFAAMLKSGVWGALGC